MTPETISAFQQHHIGHHVQLDERVLLGFVLRRTLAMILHCEDCNVNLVIVRAGFDAGERNKPPYLTTGPSEKPPAPPALAENRAPAASGFDLAAMTQSDVPKIEAPLTRLLHGVRLTSWRPSHGARGATSRSRARPW